MPKLRTKAQNSLMHGLAARIGLTHEDLQEMTFDVTGGRTEHTSELFFSEAVKIIDRLQEWANPQQKQPSRRTVQHRRQQAGIKQIVTPEHLQKLNDLWFAKPERTPSGLESLCFRIIKVNTPRTTEECSKVIEAVKSMNKRETTFGAFGKQEAA